MVKTIYKDEYADLLLLLLKKRLDAQMTQAEVCKKLGTPRSFIGKIERGERRMDVIELQTICQAPGVDFIEFMIELQERQRRQSPPHPSPLSRLFPLDQHPLQRCQ